MTSRGAQIRRLFCQNNEGQTTFQDNKEIKDPIVLKIENKSELLMNYERIKFALTTLVGNMGLIYFTGRLIDNPENFNIMFGLIFGFAVHKHFTDKQDLKDLMYGGMIRSMKLMPDKETVELVCGYEDTPHKLRIKDFKCQDAMTYDAGQYIVVDGVDTRANEPIRLVWIRAEEGKPVIMKCDDERLVLSMLSGDVEAVKSFHFKNEKW